MKKPAFPTELHELAVNTIADFFLAQEHTDTVLLLNSLARGKATPESDIDIAVLVNEENCPEKIIELTGCWEDFLKANHVLSRYVNSNRYAQIHLDIIDGDFKPGIWEDGGAVDFFELEIGNRLLYSAPLNTGGRHFEKLRLQWLPYYDVTLQNQRLQLSKASCLYELSHIPIFIKRALYFQAFDRLYVAFQKFLQTLFIKHGTYPIAYNKWIKEQMTDILKLPDLYTELPGIISVSHLESDEINEKAKKLEQLLHQYC
jgi:predicted nucleotidyltransferase